MSTLRLILALLLPSVLVAWAMLVVKDVRVAFLVYTLGGCALIPWLLLGALPLRGGRGLPFLPAIAPRAPGV